MKNKLNWEIANIPIYQKYIKNVTWLLALKKIWHQYISETENNYNMKRNISMGLYWFFFFNFLWGQYILCYIFWIPKYPNTVLHVLVKNLSNNFDIRLFMMLSTSGIGSWGIYCSPINCSVIYHWILNEINFETWQVKIIPLTPNLLLFFVEWFDILVTFYNFLTLRSEYLENNIIWIID